MKLGPEVDQTGLAHGDEARLRILGELETFLVDRLAEFRAKNIATEDLAFVVLQTSDPVGALLTPILDPEATGELTGLFIKPSDLGRVLESIRGQVKDQAHVTATIWELSQFRPAAGYTCAVVVAEGGISCWQVRPEKPRPIGQA